MSRNSYTFGSHPADVDIRRSKLNKNCSVKTSFNVGDIIPFYVDEVLPGETRQIKTSEVVRLQTLVTPVMDNIFMDVYYFFVPNRILWSHWREFMGENTTAPWIQTTTYTIPQLIGLLRRQLKHAFDPRVPLQLDDDLPDLRP